MAINIRAKGQNAEREVATVLNEIIGRCKERRGLKHSSIDSVLRNQQQSSVGGADLQGTFGLAIEIKRQENLSVGTWWKQCLEQAVRLGEHPVLIYRQSHKPWTVVTGAVLMLPGVERPSNCMHVKATIEWDDFLAWFECWVDRKLSEQG